MKTKLSAWLIAVLICCSWSSLFAQGFTPPSEGKAVVYFSRVSGLGFAISFDFFDGDKFIGAFKGANYMRYECDPGQHLLWASSENKEFVTAELQAGQTYIVIVDVIMGAWKARVGMSPITKDSELLDRVKKLVNKKVPVVTPEKTIQKENEKLKDFIADKLKLYEEKWKQEKNFKSITPDMAIPESDLK